MNHTPRLRIDKRDAADLENAAHEYGNTGDHDTYIRKVATIRYHLHGPDPDHRTPLATANVQHMFYNWERHPQLYALLEPMG